MTRQERLEALRWEILALALPVVVIAASLALLALAYGRLLTAAGLFLAGQSVVAVQFARVLRAVRKLR